MCCENQPGILCNVCKTWIHFSCTTLSIDEHVRLSDNVNEWYCQSCLSSVFPFNHINVEYINCINNINYSKRINIAALSSLKQFNFVNACKIVNKKY